MALPSEAVTHCPRREAWTAIHLIAFLLIWCCATGTAAPCLGQEAPWQPVLRLETKDGHLVLEARDVSLGELLMEYRRECRIIITGLEHRVKEPISFTPKPASPDRILRQLLNLLGENNYLFEYEGEKLKRAFVISEGVNGNQAGSPADPRFKPDQERRVQVAVVQDILKGTQAEFLNLMRDDVVLSYDHVSIRGAQHLATEVRARPKGNQVEMYILRNEHPIRFILDTGLIGIRLVDRTVPYVPAMTPFLNQEAKPSGEGGRPVPR